MRTRSNLRSIGLRLAMLAALGPALAVPAGAQLAAGPQGAGPGTQPSGADLTSATRVSLRFDGAAPKDAFAALSEQAGVVFRTAPKDLWEKQPAARLSVKLEDVTFWAAMRELCEKSGLTVQRAGQEGQMVLSSAPAGARQWVGYPSSEWGPFMTVAQTLRREHQSDLVAGDGVTRRCTLAMSLYSEPRVKVLKVGQQASIELAVDEKGTSLVQEAGGLAPPRAPVVQQVMAGGQWVWTVTASLSPPADAGQSIARLRGSVSAVAQTRSQSLEVDKVLAAKNSVHTLGGHRLLIKDLRQVGTGYTLLATITRDRAAGDTWQDVAAGNMIRLLDAEGRSLTRRSYTNRWGSAASMDLSLSFGREDFNVGDQVGEPAKLIWEVPLEVKEVRIPFEFAGLPLP